MPDWSISVLSVLVAFGWFVGMVVLLAASGVWMWTLLTGRPREDRVRRYSARVSWAGCGTWVVATALFAGAIGYLANS